MFLYLAKQVLIFYSVVHMLVNYQFGCYVSHCVQNLDGMEYGIGEVNDAGLSYAA